MLRVICEVQPTWVIGENVSGIINMELDNVLSDLEAQGYAAQTFVLPACSVDAKHRRDRVWIVAHSNSQGEPNESERVGKGKRVLAHPSGQSRRSGRVYPESGDQGWGAGEARGESIQSRDWEAQSDNPTKSSENVANSDNGHWSREIKGVLGKQKGETSDRSTGSSENVANSAPHRLQGGQELQGAASFGTRRVQQPQRCNDYATSTIWESEPNVGRVADGVPDRTHTDLKD